MNIKFTDARNELIDYVKNQLVGPVGGADEKLNDAPHKRYLMGTLFPPTACVDETDESQGEDSTTEALSNDFKPSSMAMSFAVENNSVFQIEVEAGHYKKGQNFVWQRTPLNYTKKFDISASSKETIFDGSARLDITIRPYLKGKVVTVALSNQEKSGEKLDPSKCLYQSSMKVTLLEGGIKEYPSSDRFKLDEEQKELDLIYRKRVPWAVGHGVAADWELKYPSTSPVSLYTESMPLHEVKDFSTDIDTQKYPDLKTDILSITKIADPDSASSEELIQGYNHLVKSYNHWIDEIDNEALDTRYHAAKKRIIERLKSAANRMQKGIALLSSSKTAMEAFRLANKAMLMQMIHTGKDLAGDPKIRDWGYIPPDYFSEEVVKNFNWRPFQLAFQLLVLESIIPDPDSGAFSESRNDVDLLWFPTGGGKTEAYLAVAAWEMIYRRLTQREKGGGTAVIKRYTLRLLTSQQFQRAGSLICALEIIRREDSCLGDEMFSLGLWAGQGSTPNEYSTAHEKFTLARQDQEPENSFQLQTCPWCGTEIMPKKHEEDSNYYGIRCNPDSKFEFFCPSSSCDFHDFLPVQVIDQALYESPPSLLIGTVDKFARLTWKAEAGAFFGNGKKSPPSLIIQDELHLISGPLGTITGIYEAGFDSIIELMGNKPKVIAATATIRAAQQQVTRLFGRNVNIFPPSGTDEADSFFSKEDKSRPGRLYAGIMPSGHTGQTALIQTGAAVLQAPYELGFENEILDSYWTVPIYHNSRRELGKSMTLARDDIPDRIKVIAREPRDVQWVEELSAGIKGSRIPEVLEKLSKSVESGQDAVDVLPCTNMISVGVDISRLGMMIITGQPKATAEYIQASSRVGRSKKRPPGVVITLYSPTKPRDRSHYETFKSYHQALYRYVEPTSVTPWAKPALERALHAAMIAVVRVTGYLRRNDSAKYFDSENADFRNIRDVLTRRITAAMAGMPVSEQVEVLDYLQSLIDTWEQRCQRSPGGLTQYENTSSGKQFQPLIQTFENSNHGEAWKTLNSMRNVDTQTHLYIRGEL